MAVPTVVGDSAAVVLDGHYATFGTGSNGALAAHWVILDTFVGGESIAPLTVGQSNQGLAWGQKPDSGVLHSATRRTDRDRRVGQGGAGPPMSARPARITAAGQLALELPLELPPIALAPEWKDQQRLWGHTFHPMCSYLASFPAALTHAFIARYSRPG